MLPIEKQIESLKSQWLAFRGQDFDTHLTICESPIERLFLAGFLCSGWFSPHEHGPPLNAARDAKLNTDVGWYFEHPHDNSIWLYAQPEIGLEGKRYRLDFTMIVYGEKLVVELDGYEFHERTKEQATRDKSRDRALTRDGWRVLRFTGSEVFADVRKVHDEVIAVMNEAFRAAHAKAPKAVAQ